MCRPSADWDKISLCFYHKDQAKANAGMAMPNWFLECNGKIFSPNSKKRVIRRKIKRRVNKVRRIKKRVKKMK